MLCPICKTPVDEDESKRPLTFPFCSERCKLIDLGRWLDGKYRIPPDSDDVSPIDKSRNKPDKRQARGLNDESPPL